MTLRVVAMRSAVNQYGRAFGTRSLPRVWDSLAAYDESSSRAAGSTFVRPRTVLIITGKKTITATIVRRGRMLSGPNQFRVIGAKAMIGMALAPTATGIRSSRAVAHRAVASPPRVPSTTPTSRPPTASVPVKTTPLARVGHSDARLAAMTLGLGTRNDFTPSARSDSSQNARTTTNTIPAGSHSRIAWPLTGLASSRQALGPDPVGSDRIAWLVGRLVPAKGLPDPGHELEIALGLTRLDRPGGRQVDVD